jgi:hypothetical protein
VDHKPSCRSTSPDIATVKRRSGSAGSSIGVCVGGSVGVRVGDAEGEPEGGSEGELDGDSEADGVGAAGGRASDVCDVQAAASSSAVDAATLRRPPAGFIVAPFGCQPQSSGGLLVRRGSS